jgi:uncharacterized protein
MLVVKTSLAPSPIHGFGVFAQEPVSRGQVISRFVPPLDVQFTVGLLESLSPVEQAYLQCYAYRSLYTGLYILTGDADRFMNHSEIPNVGMDPHEPTRSVALRDIAAGQELTCDYRTFDADWQLKLPNP